MYFGGLGRESIGNQQPDGDDRRNGNNDIQFSAGVTGNRPGSVNVAFLNYSIGRELIHPGENQRRNQSYREEQHNKPWRPVGQTKYGRYDINDLQNHPCSNSIGNRYTYYVTAFQFLNNRHFVLIVATRFQAASYQ